VLFERIVYSGLLDMVREGDTQAMEAWIDQCSEEGPAYASPAEHRASVASGLGSAPGPGADSPGSEHAGASPERDAAGMRR